MADIVTGGSILKWRIGTKCNLNVYEGARPVFQAHNSVDAKRIVNAMNIARNTLACDINIARIREAIAVLVDGFDFSGCSNEPFIKLISDLDDLARMNDRDEI